MSYTILIPARLQSTRLPRKPLLKIGHLPMVVVVAQQAARANARAVIVATDDAEIVDVCQAHGIHALLTRADHPTGTDRLSEAVTTLGLPDDEVIVNLQGDEPLMPPAILDQVAQLLLDRPDASMGTMACHIHDAQTFLNPNVVKVELNAQGYAQTFSRAPIPWPRDAFRVDSTQLPEGFTPLHHVGLYSYRVGFLKRYPQLPQAPQEALESLEQLRALYWGEKIAVQTIDSHLPPGVDTAEDLERVRMILNAG